MKKALKLTALCLVLVMTVLTLASCGAPSGKYTASYFLGGKVTLDFTEEDVTVLIADPILGTELFKKTTTYTIEDDKITIDFEEKEDTDSDVAQAIIAVLREPVPYAKAEEGIKINKVTFTKDPVPATTETTAEEGADEKAPQ